MPLVNLARDMLADAIIGGSTFNKISNANGHLGVGDSTTAFNATQTDLIGTNFRRPMDATFPQRTANVLTLQATFGTGEANFAWQEYGIFNAVSSGQMLSRKVASLGTKTSAASWVLEVTATFVLV